MVGLGSDIELAIDTILDGLELPIDLSTVEDNRLRQAMDSKVSAFKYTKELLDKWINSPNKPSEEKFKSYITRLVDTGDSSIDSLRQALRKKIDYADLDPTKIPEAVKAKSSILQYIHQLDTSLMELRIQIEQDKFNLSDREFKVGFPERFANGEFFPEENYHTEWYNSDEDAVMICPKGTKGEIIEIEGLRVQLPKKPKKADILFSNLPKKEQYWKREELPDGVNPDTEDAFADYIYTQFRRRREGVWFMNNGKAEYMTGHMWFALEHCKMRDTGGYMDFRYAQMEMYYFAEACIRDRRALGELFVKSRRTGFTYIILTIMLNDATMTKNVNIGMTSQSDADAKKAFVKFSYMFQNLPFFFRPVVKGAVDSHKILEFAKPSDKSKAAKLARLNKTEDYLNTIIDFQPTKDGSYDGQRLYRYLGDEASKWQKPANYENHFGRISPTFDEGGNIVGKAFIGSTVNPMKKGGEEFKAMYYGSLMTKRDKHTERTPTGLYSYFLPAHKNMSKFTDKYGVCHTETPKVLTFNVHGEVIKGGSIAFLEARRKQKKRESDIAYNEELRAFPMTVQEALRDEAKSNIFNIEKINEQLEAAENMILAHHITQGNFEWEGGIKDTKVVWKPSPTGRFFVSWIPKKEMQNAYEIKRGVRHPLNSHIGCFGCDSYDISGTVSGKGSKGSLHGVTGFTMEDAPSNVFFLEYISRAATAEIFFEDVLMACVFYGMPILCENNKPRLLYHFKNRGYRGFSLSRPDKAVNKLSVTERELGGIPSSSKDVITTHASFIENFISNFVGVYNEQDETKQVREYGSMGNMFFKRTLKDWLQFDITAREKHDATISSGYALMGLNRAKLTPVPELKTISIGMATFDNKGHQSKLR